MVFCYLIAYLDFVVFVFSFAWSFMVFAASGVLLCALMCFDFIVWFFDFVFAWWFGCIVLILCFLLRGCVYLDWFCLCVGLCFFLFMFSVLDF